jgi:hypothetical protein
MADLNIPGAWPKDFDNQSLSQTTMSDGCECGIAAEIPSATDISFFSTSKTPQESTWSTTQQIRLPSSSSTQVYQGTHAQSESHSVPRDTSLPTTPPMNDGRLIMIAVLGQTGAGKPSFIRAATDDEDLEIGHGLDSCKIHQPGQGFEITNAQYRRCTA